MLALHMISDIYVFFVPLYIFQLSSISNTLHWQREKNKPQMLFFTIVTFTKLLISCIQ